MENSLQRTLADAAAFLRDERLAYALIGGIAASLHGQPRVTADVDLVVAADVDRALELLRSLDGKPFSPLFDGAEQVVERAFILPMRHGVTGIKVDLAIGLSGFERQAIARAEPITLGDHTIFVARAEDVILLKLLAGRPQDEQDIRGIVVAQHENLDWPYCLKVATELEEATGQALARRIHELRQDSAEKE